MNRMQVDLLSSIGRESRLLLGLLALGILTACGGEPTDVAIAPMQPAMTDQILVKFKDGSVAARYQAMTAEVAASLSQAGGARLVPVRVAFAQSHVLALSKAIPESQVREIAAKIAKRSDVEFAEPNSIAHTMAIPNDPLFSKQWDLREASVAGGGANIPDAWDVTTGDPSLVVAVVDTGVLHHADFGSRLLPGYDFVSNSASANDGDGRDANSTDPGNWISQSELTTYGATNPVPSSWHGTHVAGTIGASGNNGYGITGINWQSKILPIRVLGKGGGYMADIADGIVWAVGYHFAGIPDNTNIARVINLSLGGSGPCPAQTQSAINYALARNAVIVVAAGNERQDASLVQPANCVGVITVAAVGQSGRGARYTNFGSVVTIAAPGGDMPRDVGILSLGDGGHQAPLNDNGFIAMMGTSQATPHVTGIISLMLSVNPSLTPAQVKTIIQATARPFPTGTGYDCTTSFCGAGIVNATAAVKAAASGQAAIALGQPESGWWWNPVEGGRGYALEIRDGKLFFAGFLYDFSGRSTWIASGPTQMTTPFRYSGSLDMYAGGQTLNGFFKPAILQGSVGQLNITFTDATHAIMTWPGGSVPIQRYEFANAGLTTAKLGFSPESGWWWNPLEGGRGFAIEVQGSNFFMAGFFYDDNGNPVWNVTSGPMAETDTYLGNWVQYANGQTLLGSFKPAQVINSNAGAVQLKFTDTAHAALTLPNGTITQLERFTVGYQSPLLSISNNMLMSAKLIGIWDMRYTIISTFDDFYLLNMLRESTITPGQFNVWGLDVYNRLVLGYYDPQYQTFAVYDPGTIIDQFYVFDMPSQSTLSGCYYQIDLLTNIMSKCFPMSGVKLAEVTPFSVNSFGSNLTSSLVGREAQLLSEISLPPLGMSVRASHQASGATIPLDDTRAIAAKRRLDTIRKELANGKR